MRSTPTATTSPISDQPYPPPESTNSQPQVNSNTAYPAPIPSTQPTAIPISPIPKDRPVGVLSNGQVIDLDRAMSELPNKIVVSSSGNYVPPTIPKSNQSNGLSPNIVIGPDGRFKVNNTKVFPYSTVVRITYENSSGSFICTGWMLGPSTVVTAAHCIYDYGATYEYATNVSISPAYNLDVNPPDPYGSCGVFYGLVLNYWYDSGMEGYDYGIYYLNCTVGVRTGNFGFKNIDSQGVGRTVEVPGYPGDLGNGDTMWSGIGHVTDLPAGDVLVFYDVDTNHGQSGAPVMDVSDFSCNYCVVATHSGPTGDQTKNQGARINDWTVNFLLSQQSFIAKQVYLPLIMNNP